MITGDRLVKVWKAMKDAGKDKIDDFGQLLDAESRSRFIAKICKEDGVDEAEAWRLIREEPKYSMGFKMCSPAVVMSLKSKRGKEKFREILTPDELRIFDEEVDGKIDFKSAIKNEFKLQKKKGKA